MRKRLIRQIGPDRYVGGDRVTTLAQVFLWQRKSDVSSPLKICSSKSFFPIFCYMKRQPESGTGDWRFFMISLTVPASCSASGKPTIELSSAIPKIRVPSDVLAKALTLLHQLLGFLRSAVCFLSYLVASPISFSISVNFSKFIPSFP